jgi:hypothetical protein
MAQVPMINLPQITPVSQIASRVAQGNLASLQGDALQQQNQQRAQEFQRSQSLNALKQQGLTDPKARAIASRLDPDYGNKLQAYEAAQQDYETKKAVFWGGQTQAALDTGIAQVPGFYKKIYDKAAQSGEDMTEAPLPSNDLSLRPTDAQIQYLEFISKRGISAKNQLEMKQKQEAEKQKLQRGVNLPAAVREYEYFNKLDPQSQQQFLNVKRNVLQTGLGFDEKGSVVPLSGAPQAKEAIKIAESRGAGIGEAEADAIVKGKTVEGVLDLIDQAKKILPRATSGYAQSAFTGITSAAGVSTKKSEADTQLNVIAAGLVSNVPRMEGPQSDKDVKMYKEAAGNVGDSSVPYKSRLSALKQVERINKKYLARNKEYSSRNNKQETSNNDPLGIR